MTDQEQWNFADAKEEFTPERAEAHVCFDRQLVARLQQARARLQAAADQSDGMMNAPQVGELRAEVEDLQAQVESKQRTFVFESIGRTAWRALMGQHPPTAEQREVNPRLDHDPDSFPVAAIAAACVEPELSAKDAAWLDENLHVGEFDRLWMACYRANVSGASAPFPTTSTAARPAGGKR